MRFIKIALCIFITLFFTWASIALVSLPWIMEGEKDVITGPTEIKTYLNRHIFPFRNYFFDSSFIRDHFLIVNTTHDQMLVKEVDPHAPALPGSPVTDRKKLAKLLQMCDQDTSLFDLIVCDIEFQLLSPDPLQDSILNFYIGQLESKGKIIFGLPYHQRSDEFDTSVIVLNKNNIAATNKDPVSGYYFHHTLSYSSGTVTSLPFLLYSRHHHSTLRKSWMPGLVRYENNGTSHLFYNSFIPEMLFDRENFNDYYNDPEMTKMNITAYTNKMAVCDLGKITEDTTGYILRDLLNTSAGKKDIFIASISGEHADKHNTFYGQLDGAIILLNTYYCLELDYNKLSFWHVLISLAFFLFIAYRIVYSKRGTEHSPKTPFQYIRHEFQKRLYYLSLLFLTAISYFGFHHETNLILLLVLIEFLHTMAGHASKYRIIRQTPDVQPTGQRRIAP